MNKVDFVKWLFAAAKSGEINPIFTVAQAALESGWGKSKIGEFNLFGVTKGSSWSGPCDLVLTHEVFDTPTKKFISPEKVISINTIFVNSRKRYRYTVYRLFRRYASLADALHDHQRILRMPGYADAWPYRNNAYEFARHICDNVECKYATDPNYLKSITSIITDVSNIVKRLQL